MYLLAFGHIEHENSLNSSYNRVIMYVLVTRMDLKSRTRKKNTSWKLFRYRKKSTFRSFKRTRSKNRRWEEVENDLKSLCFSQRLVQIVTCSHAKFCYHLLKIFNCATGSHAIINNQQFTFIRGLLSAQFEQISIPKYISPELQISLLVDTNKIEIMLIPPIEWRFIRNTVGIHLQNVIMDES